MFCSTIKFNFHLRELCLILLACVSDVANTSRSVGLPLCLAFSAPPVVP